jgi:hypothetical protein
MSASPRWTIWCDNLNAEGTPACGQWIGSEENAEEARKVAKRNGWRIRPKSKGGDLCPAHAGTEGRTGIGMFR